LLACGPSSWRTASMYYRAGLAYRRDRRGLQGPIVRRYEPDEMKGLVNMRIVPFRGKKRKKKGSEFRCARCDVWHLPPYLQRFTNTNVRVRAKRLQNIYKYSEYKFDVFCLWTQTGVRSGRRTIFKLERETRNFVPPVTGFKAETRRIWHTKAPKISGGKKENFRHLLTALSRIQDGEIVLRLSYKVLSVVLLLERKRLVGGVKCQAKTSLCKCVSPDWGFLATLQTK
jgi:hypothetical protein